MQSTVHFHMAITLHYLRIEQWLEDAVHHLLVEQQDLMIAVDFNICWYSHLIEQKGACWVCATVPPVVDAEFPDSILIALWLAAVHHNTTSCWCAAQQMLQMAVVLCSSNFYLWEHFGATIMCIKNSNECSLMATGAYKLIWQQPVQLFSCRTQFAVGMLGMMA